MEKTRRRLLLLSLVLAILASGAIYLYLQSLDTRPELETVEVYQILVAKTNIPARTVVSKEMLELVQGLDKPDQSLFYTDMSQVIGQMATQALYKGGPLSKQAFLQEDDLPLNLRITGNMRAVSVGVSGVNGVANLVQPGDRVDVIVYLPEIKENQVVIRPDIVKILMQNVEVLAIDSQLDTYDYEEAIAIDETYESSKMYLATLSLPIHEVEELVLAKDIGTIDLILRPLEGDYIYDTEGVIWQELLLDDYDKLKDMFPNYGVNSVGKVAIDEDAFSYDEYIYYTVKYGDTLRSISLLFYENEDMYQLIKQVNRILDENMISAGMGLKIPLIEK